MKPFNIIGDRLFRIRLLRDKEHIYLLQDIHHIISVDASSQVQKGGALDDDYDYTPIDRLLMSNTLEKFIKALDGFGYFDAKLS